MKSMTGFGRAEVRSGGHCLGVEISSVNRKQSDIVVNLPRDWASLEIDLRKMVAQSVSRGRVQVQVKWEATASAHASLAIDRKLAREYADGLRLLAKELKLQPIASVAELLRAPGVFALEDSSTRAEEVWPLLENAVAKAMQALNKSREREGAHLLRDLQSRLAALRAALRRISDLAPEVTRQQRDALRKRLADAGQPLPLDDERLLKEIALFADKCDISEETSRLAGHLDEFTRLLKSPEPQGRAMDFLTQEMHRELNTIGAKANHSSIAHLVVAGKTEVERIREQVQNVE
jgi:uncharacterized protein (TIGR00255 family)